MKSKASAALLLATALVCTTSATAQTALDAGSIAPPAPTINDTRDKGPADPLSVLPEDVKKYGSLYLRCDGQPNNITGAESFARLLGAVTLLALFAPPPEAGDPSKRLLAERGVAACSKLLDDPREETNGLRRLPLILARAVHQFEAKDYKAALADVTKARGEAQVLGLIGNSYFDRSMGLSFNLLESQALLRLGQPAEARQVSLRNALAMPYSFYAGISTRPYSSFQRSMSTEEEQYYRNMSRISGVFGVALADRLDEVGRFSEAAVLRDETIGFLTELDGETQRSWPLANAAISHALAGNWALAAERAKKARENMDALIAKGKPEENQSAIVERLDLYDILLLAHDGKVDDARRNFAARSQWLSPSFGALLATNAMLRKDAKPEQLFGSLAQTPEQIWALREKNEMAKLLETDGNNRTLFTYILPYAQIKDYERLSKDVWNAQKSKLIAKEPIRNSKFYVVNIWSDAMTQPEALLLHSALLAKARGFSGFIYLSLPNRPQSGIVRFGNPGDAGMMSGSYLDADAVIADLRKVIPSPEELAARRKTA